MSSACPFPWTDDCEKRSDVVVTPGLMMLPPEEVKGRARARRRLRRKIACAKLCGKDFQAILIEMVDHQAPQTPPSLFGRNAIATRRALSAAGYRCQYCGVDLLSHPVLFLTAQRDHFYPQSVGGTDAAKNRLIACVLCDRLKGNRVYATLDDARAELARLRFEAMLKFFGIRSSVRGLPGPVSSRGG
jgi:5-methylcytosine-specific restriction endonuclease McrA